MSDLVNFGGGCNLSLRVSDLAVPNPYGVPSPILTVPFTIGAQPSYAFTAEVAPGCQQNFCSPVQIQVNLAGSQAASAGSDWTITTTGGKGPGNAPDPCGGSVGETTPPAFPIVVTMPDTCTDPAGADVKVTYKYLGQTITADAGAPSGTPATTTTTTSTTSTTTSTTSTTTPPDTTTTAHKGPAAAGAPLRPELAAVSGRQANAVLSVPVRGDSQIREAMLWSLVAVGVAWCGGGILRASRRTRPRKEQS
jgi:hypothetical protein